MKLKVALGVTGVLVLVLGWAPSRAVAQTGPNMDEIRRHDADARKVFAEEDARKAAEAKARQEVRDREADAKRTAEEDARIKAKEAQWRAEEKSRVEAIIATRPSTESVQALQAENQRLREEVARLTAQLKAVTEERDRLKAGAGKP